MNLNVTNLPSANAEALAQRDDTGIPAQWCKARLGEVGGLIRGVSYDKEDVCDAPAPGHVPVLRATNVQNSGLVLDSDLVYVKQERISARQRLRPDDIVIAMSSGSKAIVGKAAQLTGDWQGSFGAFCAVFRMDTDQADRRFTSYVFQSDSYRAHISTAARGTNINNLTLEHVLGYEFLLPTLPEQRAIACVLRTLREAIAARQREMELERERKAALMQHLFTHGTRGEPTKMTEIGEMPASWRIVQLGDLCTFKTGKLNSEASVPGGKYPFFTCSQETFRIDSYSFEQEAILLAGNNAQGKYSVKHYVGKFDAYQRTYVITIAAPSALDYRYLLYNLSLQLDLLRIHSLGALTKFLTTNIISSLPLRLPTKDEQETIAHMLTACDSRATTLECETALLTELYGIESGIFCTLREG